MTSIGPIPAASMASHILALNNFSAENIWAKRMPRVGEAYHFQLDEKEVASHSISGEVGRAIIVLLGSFLEKKNPPVGYAAVTENRYGKFTIARGKEDEYLFSFKPKQTFHLMINPQTE